MRGNLRKAIISAGESLANRDIMREENKRLTEEHALECKLTWVIFQCTAEG